MAGKIVALAALLAALGTTSALRDVAHLEEEAQKVQQDSGQESGRELDAAEHVAESRGELDVAEHIAERRRELDATEHLAERQGAASGGNASSMGELDAAQERLFVIPEGASCKETTGGKCNTFGCHASRGPTVCRVGSKKNLCVCAPNWCSFNGACLPKDGFCEKRTGGSCDRFGCSWSRGHTDCVSGKCMCKRGFCAHNGACWPVTATGISCKYIKSKCPKDSRCEDGICMCTGGAVSINGVCTKLPQFEGEDD